MQALPMAHISKIIVVIDSNQTLIATCMLQIIIQPSPIDVKITPLGMSFCPQ
jgi:hypothetical protein